MSATRGPRGDEPTELSRAEAQQRKEAPRHSTRDRVRGAAGGFWGADPRGWAGPLAGGFRHHVWPTVGEEIAVWATMHGLMVDVDWLGRTLRPEGYGLCVPENGHSRGWAAIESWAEQHVHVQADC
jgi:hypothetical protein